MEFKILQDTMKSHKRTLSKERNIDLWYRKDVICLNYLPIEDVWHLYVNGETFEGTGLRFMFDALEELYIKCTEKEKNKEQIRIIVFTNPLNLLCAPIKQLLKFENEVFLDNAYYEISTNHIQFRNFMTISNTSIENLKLHYPNKTDMQLMVDSLLNFGSNIHKVRYSLAHMTEKEFYKPILTESRQQRGKIFYKSLDIYNDCMTGSKAGLLAKFSGKETEYCWKIQENVKSFDKKSAYPSVFVSDDKFPLGQVTRHEGRKLNWLDKCLNEQRWFKIVIKSDFPFKPWIDPFRDKRNKKTYAIEWYDYKSLNYILGDNVIQEWLYDHDDEYIILTSDETGYMPEILRQRIIELYNIKETTKDKEDPERKRAKTMLDMLYGKGIQRLAPKDVKELNSYYFGRSQKVIMPQQSLHAVARVKYELTYLGTRCPDNTIAYDTDGIKFTGYSYGDAIKNLNNAISEQNKKAGFGGCTIGMWEHEYTAKRFVQFKTKNYCYEDAETGEIIWKLAGVKKEQLEKFLRSIGDQDPMEYIIKNGIKFMLPSYYTYNPDTLKYSQTYNEYILSNPQRGEKVDESRILRAVAS